MKKLYSVVLLAIASHTFAQDKPTPGFASYYGRKPDPKPNSAFTPFEKEAYYENIRQEKIAAAKKREQDCIDNQRAQELLAERLNSYNMLVELKGMWFTGTNELSINSSSYIEDGQIHIYNKSDTNTENQVEITLHLHKRDDQGVDHGKARSIIIIIHNQPKSDSSK